MSIHNRFNVPPEGARPCSGIIQTSANEYDLPATPLRRGGEVNTSGHGKLIFPSAFQWLHIGAKQRFVNMLKPVQSVAGVIAPAPPMAITGSRRGV